MILTAASPPKHSRTPLRVRVLFLIPVHKREQRVAKGQRKSREGEKNNPKQSAAMQSTPKPSTIKQSAIKVPMVRSATCAEPL